MLRSTLFVLSIVVAGPVYAVQLKSSIAAGSGCQANQNLGASLTGDTVSWSLPGFAARVEAQGSRLDRKNCSVTLTFQVPSGKRISPAQMSYELEANIPESAHGTFKVRTHYQSAKGDQASVIELEGPSQRSGGGDLPLTTHWSACGGEVTMTIGTSINVKRGKIKGDAALDLKNFGTVKLKQESC